MLCLTMPSISQAIGLYQGRPQRGSLISLLWLAQLTRKNNVQSSSHEYAKNGILKKFAKVGRSVAE